VIVAILGAVGDVAWTATTASQACHCRAPQRDRQDRGQGRQGALNDGISAWRVRRRLWRQPQWRGKKTSLRSAGVTKEQVIAPHAQVNSIELKSTRVETRLGDLETKVFGAPRR